MNYRRILCSNVCALSAQETVLISNINTFVTRPYKVNPDVPNGIILYNFTNFCLLYLSIAKISILRYLIIILELNISACNYYVHVASHTLSYIIRDKKNQIFFHCVL